MAAASGGAGGSSAPTPTYDNSFFKEWAKTCKVKKVQEEYERLVAEAARDSIDVHACMRKRGFVDQKGCADHTAFVRSCKRFDLFCWPSELAELGSGFVLYFHFLTFLMCFLVLAFVVQFPIMGYYASENSLDEWAAETTQKWYLTPGNLGKNGGTRTVVLVLYVVMTFLLCIAIVAKHQYQIRVEKRVDRATIQPNDFAVMVEGLPITATDESQIRQWFQEHALEPGSCESAGQTEVVKVVIGWDAREYREKMKEIRNLNKQLKDLSDKKLARELDKQPPDPAIEQGAKALQGRLQQVKKDLASGVAGAPGSLTSSGVVVVIFRYSSDHQRCLERWDSFWIRHTHGLCGGSGLPRYPVGGVPTYKLRVRRAPNSGDINWEDLGVSWQERAKTMLLTNSVMAGLVFVTFWLIYLMQWIQEQAESRWLSLLPALVIVASNVVINYATKKFAEKEYHNTVTEQTASQSIKMAIAMVVNTSGVMFFSNWDNKHWYRSGGLVADISNVVLVIGVLRPLLIGILGHIVDIKGLIKKRRMRKMDDEMRDRWMKLDTAYAANNFRFKSQQEQVAYSKAEKEKSYFKELAEPSEMDFTKRYAYAVNIFICCMIYSPLFPLLTLLGVLGLLVQYWVDKCVLLRVARRPSVPLNHAQAYHCLTLVKLFVLLLLPWSVYIFLSPSWKKQDDINTFVLPMLGAAYLFCALPLSIWRRLLCVQCLFRASLGKVADEQIVAEDYYEAQHLWPREFKYHKSHFLYKVLPEAKNPEILKPGGGAAVTKEDLKGSVGDAVLAGAHAAETKQSSVNVGKKFGAVAVGSTGTQHAPGESSGGAGGKEPEAVDLQGAAAAVSEPAVTSGPSVVPDAASHAHAGHVFATGSSPSEAPTAAGGAAGDSKPAVASRRPKPVWEFETKAGWEQFKDDCHGFIERKYQEFRGSGAKRVKVNTGKLTLSLDFHLMTQRVEGGSGQVRKIRRREEE